MPLIAFDEHSADKKNLVFNAENNLSCHFAESPLAIFTENPLNAIKYL